MLGTQEEANIAASFGYASETQAEQRMADGWHWLGYGFSRTGYLSPSKVVYKVSFNGGEQYNEQELNALAQLPDPLDARIYVPKAQLWTPTVMAMEYIDGRPVNGYALSDDLRNYLVKTLDIVDCHEGNLRLLKDGRVAVIDWGCSKLGLYRTELVC